MTKQKRNISTKTETQIVGFVCNWSAYSGVEMAGVQQKEYPASIKLIRLACLGRLHLGLLLKAFELGADGVLLLGCPSESCCYESGLEKAKELLSQAKKVLSLLGIDQQRLALVEVPLGGGDVVAKQISAFARRIEKLTSKRLPVTERMATPV